MNIEISLISIVDILSIATAFMLGLLFLTSKSKNNKANVFLGLFLWVLTTDVLTSFLDGQKIEFSYLSVLSPLSLPLLFLYVSTTINYKVKPVYLLLLIPFVLTLFNVPISLIVQYGASIFLLIHTLKILQKHKEKLGNFYSDIENKTFSWVKTIIYIYLFFYFFWVTEDLIGLQFEFIIQYFSTTSAILTLVMIYWIGYNGFSQPEIFNTFISASKEEKSIITTEEKIEKTDKQKQTEKNEQPNEEEKEHSVKIFQQLTQKIKENKLFLQKEITIRSLSKQLTINEKEFSRLIKTHTDKNFYRYINQFRVEEFKRLLKTEKANHLSLLGLSEEAGFSSKSTFYSAFKTSEGMTPKQYQNQLNKSE